jgi:hypothetical protein
MIYQIETNKIRVKQVNYPRLKTGGMSREGCEQLVDKEA